MESNEKETKIAKLFKYVDNKLKLKLKEDQDSSINQEKYLKSKVKCYGYKNPEVDLFFIDNLKSNVNFQSFTVEEQFELAIAFLRSEYRENKLISTKILNLISKKITREQFDELNSFIRKEGLINEWSTADALASKFYKFYGLISRENTLAITNLKLEENSWLRRISIVSFINRVRFGDEKPNFDGFINLMFESCDELAKYEERFNQLALGWILRELSQIDYKKYKNWIFENYDNLNRECIRYSIEKLKQNQKKQILCFRSIRKPIIKTKRKK